MGTGDDAPRSGSAANYFRDCAPTFTARSPPPRPTGTETLDHRTCSHAVQGMAFVARHSQRSPIKVAVDTRCKTSAEHDLRKLSEPASTVSIMDREWVREQLEAFRDLSDQYQVENQRNVNEYTPRMRELSRQMTASAPRIRKIFEQLAPDLVGEIKEPEYIGGAGDSLRATIQALTILNEQMEWEVRLVPDAPSLRADGFHPQIWEAARLLWDTGKYRLAVGQAAISLSAHLATKAGSHLTERKLANEVFSPSPPKVGQVRLHLPGDPRSESWKSRQAGLHLIAQGAFAGIRNEAAHTNEEWAEQEALEALAVLSVVARWADETELRGGGTADP